MTTLFKFDRELNLGMDYNQLSEAVTSLSHEYQYLEFDEMFVIKDIELAESGHIIFSGNVDKAVQN